MIYAVQLAGLVGLYLAARSRDEGLRWLGRYVAAVALLSSMCNWDVW